MPYLRHETWWMRKSQLDNQAWIGLKHATHALGPQETWADLITPQAIGGVVVLDTW